MGDVRDIADGTNKGPKANQKLSQWAHGQFVQYLSYKGQRRGMVVEQIDEAYSTRTCSCCGYIHPHARRGRVLRCTNPGCRALVHRDVNGAAGYPLGDLLASGVRRGCACAYPSTHVSARVCRSASDTGQDVQGIGFPFSCRSAGTLQGAAYPGDGTTPSC